MYERKPRDCGGVSDYEEPLGFRLEYARRLSHFSDELRRFVRETHEVITYPV
jgi:hypothetical protein